MLSEAKRMDYKKILLIGHLGKYIKLAAGIFNTHSKVADARSEILVAYLALMGAPLEMLQKVEKCLTTESAMELIAGSRYEEVYTLVAQKCKERSELYINEDTIQAEAVIFSLDGKLLGQSEKARELMEEFK
jgi:cobalt-precorrin-5B (C1)-methyltransferase